MLELLHLLAFSIAVLFFNGALLVSFGHRIKKGHWLFSSAMLAVVLLATQTLLNDALSIHIGNSILLIAFIAGLAVIACTDHWNALGQICFAMVLLCAVSYLAYIADISLFSSLETLRLLLSSILLVLIASSLTLMVAHTFELIDVLCRIRWKRAFIPRPTENYFPKVSLHVPAYNEPPEMVIETLTALARLDYPNYEVIMVDDNTTDEALWRPVEAHCRKLGFKFFHLENWPGFKSGALNYALLHTSPDAEIIGVVDSDYIVEPNYLKELVGFFQNGNLAFVQTPQDYRDFNTKDRFQSACYQAYQYFFKFTMVSRNERNSIIFAGTMGLIRRCVLEAVGGWNEWCITEDAEIALKILDMGYESIFIDKTYGRGVMPLNYEGLKKQRFRWAFGGMQVLRLHWKKLLPFASRVNGKNKLTLAQKYDYWAGGLQWLNDPIAFAFTAILIVSSMALVLTKHSILPQPTINAILFIPFMFLALGFARMLWALRTRLESSLHEAYRAFMVFLSLTWIVTLACTLGLTRKKGEFLRTPKQKCYQSMITSMRLVSEETLLSLICVACIVMIHLMLPLTATTALLIGLLLWQSYLYISALVVNQWGLRSQFHVDSLMLNSIKQGAARSRGVASSLGTAVVVLGTILCVLTLYHFSIKNIQNIESIFRADPLRQSLAVHHRIITPSKALFGPHIALKGGAALLKSSSRY